MINTQNIIDHVKDYLIPFERDHQNSNRSPLSRFDKWIGLSLSAGKNLAEIKEGSPLHDFYKLNDDGPWHAIFMMENTHPDFSKFELGVINGGTVHHLDSYWFVRQATLTNGVARFACYEIDIP